MALVTAAAFLLSVRLQAQAVDVLDAVILVLGLVAVVLLLVIRRLLPRSETRTTQ